MPAKLTEVVRQGEDVVLGLNRSENIYLAVRGIGAR